jgi:hypothetical protein
MDHLQDSRYLVCARKNSWKYSGGPLFALREGTFIWLIVASGLFTKECAFKFQHGTGCPHITH